jgi:hypothetical protein
MMRQEESRAVLGPVFCLSERRKDRAEDGPALLLSQRDVHPAVADKSEAFVEPLFERE